MELDHVLLAVPDLRAGAREMQARHGLVAVDGGRHPGWGTANRIVPLGPAYLELVAVVDAAEAAETPFGSWVAGVRPGTVRPFGWAVRTDELDAVARRLGLTVAAGSRAARDGRLVRWRLAGIEQAAAEPSLPFFIEWGDGTPLPGRTPAEHPAGAARIDRLELTGDADRLRGWLGEHDLPVTIAPGPPAVTRLVLAGTAGTIVVDAAGG
jgi:hypothetical protein